MLKGVLSNNFFMPESVSFEFIPGKILKSKSNNVLIFFVILFLNLNQHENRNYYEKH